LPRGSLKRIGVLACQGAFAEHLEIFHQLGVSAFPVRLSDEIDGLDGLVLPGGESTTMSKLIREYDLIPPITKLCRDGIPVMGTCAGMILLANNVSSTDGVAPLGVMDIDIKRNAFGRQVDSFEADIPIPAIGAPPFHCIFIRAPLIERSGVGVEVLARLPDETAVAARQGNMIAMSFHPELTGDLRLHSYFLSIVDGGENR
jgi:5'-phosphate synthase pdxT subunit